MDLRKYKPPPGAPDYSRNHMFDQRKSITEEYPRSFGDRDPMMASADFARQEMPRVSFSPGRDVMPGMSIDPVERRHDELKHAIAMKERQLQDLESERNTAEQLRSKLGIHRTGSGLIGGSGQGTGTMGTKRGSPLRGTRKSVSPHENLLGGLRSTHMRNTSATMGPSTNEYVDNSIRKDPTLAGSYGQPLQFYPSRMSRRELAPVQLTRPEIIQQPVLFKRSIGKSAEKHLGPNVTEVPLSVTNSRVDLSRNDTGFDRSISPYERASRNRVSPLRQSPFHHESSYMPESSIRAAVIQNSTINRSKSRDHSTEKPILHSTSPIGAAFAGPRFSLGPPADVSMSTIKDLPPPPRTFGIHGAKGDLYRERVDIMNMDNESLQRRLNQVSLELSRIHQEKTDLLKQLCAFEKENFNKEQALNMKDETDMHNHGMQEELQRAKDANETLKREVDGRTRENVDNEHQITNVTAAKSNLAMESNNLNMEYSKKLNVLDAVSRERCDTIKEINQTNLDLDRLNSQEHHLNRCNIDIDQENQRIQVERAELLKNLEHLTKTFDDCVRDITRERRNMDRNNDRQTKLIVAKIIFQNLELFQVARKQVAFTDMHNYIQFDSTCQKKLRDFGNACDKVGKWMLQKALHKWYDNTLKPFNLKRVNDDVSLMGRCNQLQAKVFYAWVQYNRDCGKLYNSKTNAVENIYHILSRNSRCEMKKAMNIWKGNKHFADVRYRKFYNLLSRRKKNEKFLALMAWKQWSTYLEYQCRLKVAQITYTQKVFLSQCFSQMRLITRHDKQKRIRTLNHFLKGWKDYIHYNRHLMQVNMAALRFGQVRREASMRKCLDQLRQNNKQERWQRKYDNLKNEVEVAIANHSLFNKDKRSAMLTQSQVAAGEAISEFLGKSFYSYFYYWRALNRDFQMNMNTKVKDQLVKLYKYNLKTSFIKWRDTCFQQINNKKMLEVELLQSVCAQQAREAEQGATYLRQKAESLMSQQSSMSDKMFRRLFYRKLYSAVSRWKDIVNHKTSQEQKQKKIIIRMHKRHIREAFDGLLDFNKLFIQKQRNRKGAEYMREQLIMRRMRKNFDALCQIAHRDKVAKEYWTRILTKMDKFMKKRAMKIWNENAHRLREQGHNDHQNQIISEIEEMTAVICKYEQESQNQNNEMGATNSDERNMAYRTIGNTFMRQYTDSLRYTWKIWRQKVRDERHKKQLLRKTIYHYKKHQMEFVGQVFKKFVHETKKAELQETTKKTIEEQEYAQLYIANNNQAQEELRTNRKAQLTKTGHKCSILQQRYGKLIEAISRRNSEWTFVKKQRAQVQMLQNVVKQETAFVHCIRDVVTKNCQKVAFDAVYHAYRQMRRDDMIKRNLRKMVHRLEKNVFTTGFTYIKYGALSNANARDRQVQDQTMQTNQQFLMQVDKIKDNNNARMFKYFMERNTANAFSALRNVTKFLRLQKAKTEEFHTRRERIRVVNALRRWKYRKDKTLCFKARVAQLKWKLIFKNYKASFFAWRGLAKGDFGFFNKLSNLELAFRERMFQQAFKNIKSYAESRGMNRGNNFNYGGQQMARFLMTGFQGRLRAAWQRWSHKDAKFNVQRSRLKMAYGKAISKRMRDAFEWWRKRHELAELEAEMHESGPVRVQWWEQKREISNLKKFMEKERYTEDEIDGLYDHVHETNETLLKKHTARWKCATSKDKRMLPIVWQRWRYYCGNVKLLKFMCRNCYNNCQDELAEKQLAFKRWRQKPMALENRLSRMPAQTLVEMAVQTTKDVSECSDTLTENQSIQNHLLVQRDEFLNYFIKGQVLAMAYVRDKAYFAEMQAISRWRWVVHEQRCIEFRQEQQGADEELAELERNQDYLNGNIPKLERDNAEMKLFKTDAQTIRKNMERLKADRDRIKGKIDDSEQDYLELLDENEKLQREVAEAEANAKENKNPAFRETLAIKKEPEVKKAFAETEEQKKQRLRFEKLAKMNQGTSLR